MAERIEWEEIERWDMWNDPHVASEAQRVTEADVCRLLAALEAGEAMHAALAKHQRVGPRHEQECDWCRALTAWRRCVAPRGEGA